MDTQSLPIVPFGKYKGQPITALMNDTKYLEWCKQQEWFQKFPVVYNICVNQTITTTNTNSKTPEHNKLQNMFLNETFQIKLLNILLGSNVGAKFKQNFELLILDEEFISHFGNIEIPQINRSLKDSKIVFEEKYNWDFILHYFDYQDIMLKTKTDNKKISKDKLYNILRKYKFIYNSSVNIRVLDTYIEENNEDHNYSVRIDTLCSSCNVCCELKPVLSDDYPCVLRKMKTQIELTENDKEFEKIYKIYILIIGSFTSTNTSKEQLITIFKQSKINIIFTEEIFDILQCQDANELLDKSQSIQQNSLKTEKENKLLREKLLQAEEKIKQLEEEISSLKSQKQSKNIKDYFGKK